MRRMHGTAAATLLIALAGFGCAGKRGEKAEGDSAGAESAASPAGVITRYAEIVLNEYEESLAAANEMREAIAAFLDAPGESTLAAARESWVRAHVIYGPSEAFRFYDGPIDNAVDGPEGRINGWPMDEVYVDYVRDRPDAGIINNPAAHPVLDAYEIGDLNEQGGEENIATGFHAIEFLLWGQDFSETGPGDRPWGDYAEGAGAANAGRRGTYLKVITDMLVSDLESMVRAWDPDNPAAYIHGFLKEDPSEALTKIFTGIGMLAGDELAGERMAVAFDTSDQEDEQSCFSDTTHMDLRANAEGIRMVYLGTLGEESGPGLSALVAEKDADLDGRVRAALMATDAALAAIPPPLDQVLVSPRDSEARKKMLAAIESLEKEAVLISEAAAALGITLNLGG